MTTIGSPEWWRNKAAIARREAWMALTHWEGHPGWDGTSPIADERNAEANLFEEEADRAEREQGSFSAAMSNAPRPDRVFDRAWNEAIEAAAKVCEAARGTQRGERYEDQTRYDALDSASDSIRALRRERP